MTNRKACPGGKGHGDWGHALDTGGLVKICHKCSGYRAMAPASEPRSVQIEIRAAELATMTGPQRYTPRFMRSNAISRDEMRGWDYAMLGIATKRICDETANEDEWRAGYLARIVHEHKPE